MRRIFGIVSLFLLLVPTFPSSLRSADLKIFQKTLKFTVIHPFKTVNGVCGEVNITPTTYSTGANGIQLPKAVKIEAPLKEFRSGDENRDSHIIESLGFPENQSVSFSSTSIDITDGGWLVSGNLTINGVTKPVKTKANISSSDGQIEVSGKFQIKMGEYQITPPSLLFAKAKEEVEIEFSFLLKP
ncbi:YceI-like domain protein [Leptospira broomii serovar Hurstbridge str. 5399]|uniref:YceI-like domain protein n=1 Tax=Leptospira broomii serovar Hurstbridge str. 5399 TaxID=1049789 RepID=T0EWR7_9LEPT|nr:YceI family protein [Leptospira broomii]EQA43320.1 YceI-like domain protein [Leptospira broomii serovar Hurstbridge str. 5399]